MFALNLFLKVLVLTFMFKGCYLITTDKPNGAAQLLWNLSERALLGESMGRQYGLSNIGHAQQNGYGYQNYGSGYPLQTPPPYPQNPLYSLNNQPQNIMNVLDTIARNDDLQCVPKLLCELTSGSRTITGKQSSFLPFEFNMDSLVGLLSSFGNTQTSPLLHFGRAILLGYSGKGNTNSCAYSFPRCPNDPDKLVRYLNNYNGGFFRYFQGAPYHQAPPRFDGKYRVEQRIQTRPQRLSADNRFRPDITFPSDDSHYLGGAFYGHKSQKTLRFPSDEYFRKQKLLSFPTTNVVNNDVVRFEKILPNHVASPVIFPTRTGTGELLLDTDDFHFNTGYNQQNNVLFV